MAEMHGQSGPNTSPRQRDQRHEQLVPPAPEALTETREEPIDFEAHDTIPAPPWLDDDIAPAEIARREP